MANALRTTFWDSVKGVAIVAVIVIHASDPLLAQASWSPAWILGLVLNQFLDFAVPLFLAMSGFFARYDEREGTLSYYKSRFKRLTGPYLLWTLVYLAILDPGDLESPRRLALVVGTGTGIGIGYFVIVLAQFVLLTPLLAEIRRQRTHLAVMAITAAIGLIYSYTVRLHQGSGVLGQFPANALPFFVWYPFYHFGFYLKRYPEEAKVLVRRAPALALIFLGLSFGEGMWLAELGNVVFAASQIKVTSFGFSATLFVWLVGRSFHAAMPMPKGVFIWWGQNSYSIYLMHMLVLRGLNRLLMRLPLFHGWVLLKVALSTAFVLTICSAAVWLIHHIPQKLQPFGDTENIRAI
ncbi:acyltransferase [Phyllobacterium sp. P5_D12]